ncbi:hypothetical protein, partial [Streptomyces sp. NPDC093149]|uniref:hypothetical protein n=1 Tax=Streptomyces sp. NPDC093149 TaxID=3366031 RepID=UPI0037FF7D23
LPLYSPAEHSLGLSSGLFPSVLRFRLYQTLSCPIPGRSGAAFQFHAFAFSFAAIPTLPDSFLTVSGSNLNSGGLWSGLAFRRTRLYQNF